MTNWSNYISNTKDSPPRPVFIEALSYCENGNSALDLGAGALNETRYLADHGYHVVAVDSNPAISSLAGDMNGVEAHATSIEEYDFPTDSFDIIAALYSLPFLKKEDVSDIVGKIRHSLRVRGIFVGQFFGTHDDWSRECSTYARAEIQALFDDMEIIRLTESEYDKPTAAGKPKHWHVFDVIARK
jgi:SAM-dependent methyltransferase